MPDGQLKGILNINIDIIRSNLADIFPGEKFDREIERVRSDFAGLVDKETAALYLAVENGKFKPEKKNLGELEDGEHVSVSGEIIRVDPLHTFNRKDGTVGRVQSIFIREGKNEVRVSFWENRDIEKFLNHEIKQGDSLNIVNGRVRVNNYGITINIGSYSIVETKK